jgi:hypothetical protein
MIKRQKQFSVEIVKAVLAVFVLLGGTHGGAFADEDCLMYKVSPKIVIKSPEWQKSVVQPLKPMNLLHGTVSATYVENYEIAVDSVAIEDGYCLVLKEVVATVGYSDFLVQIDARHIPGSCGYESTLAHEDEHIRVHLTTIDENAKEIKRSIGDGAESILPIFVKTLDDADKIMDHINYELQENPNIILMRQKISADQELRNKKIDQNEDNSRINECLLNQKNI